MENMMQEPFQEFINPTEAKCTCCGNWEDLENGEMIDDYFYCDNCLEDMKE